MRNTPRHPRIVSVKLDGDLDRKLTDFAYDKGVTRSAVVREALEAYTVTRKRSALDIAGDAVGSLQGPGDLSTNKKYMKGFGK